MSRVGGVSREEGVHVDVTGDPRWNVFLSSLKEKGYFQVSFIVYATSDLLVASFPGNKIKPLKEMSMLY